MKQEQLKESRREYTVLTNVEGDMMFHIIKLGTEVLYAVVYDDAYQLYTGDTKVMTADQIRKEIYDGFKEF